MCLNGPPRIHLRPHSYAGTTPLVYACTSTVSNLQYFDDFMTQLVTRYPTQIQIYELWSEPNVSNVYTGSFADLATLTSHAYNIIRQYNPTATILSPSPTAAPYLLSYLTTPGAPLGFDAVAIHGYPNVADNDVPEALVGFKTVNIKLAMLQAPGVGVKPIWDSEGSWGDSAVNAITDPNLRTAFVARSLLLHWSVGIHNMYWYGWDAPNWGTLYYPPPGVGITPAATAFGVTYNWMIGASMPTPCTANGGTTFAAVYTCQLVRSGGYTALAVWDTNQTCANGSLFSTSYTPPPLVRFGNSDLAGGVTSITPGQTLQIGVKPILLENMDAPPVANNLNFSYTGLTASFASSAAANPSLPEVPASSNLAPTTPPVTGQIPLNNLLVMPGLSAPTSQQALDSDAIVAAGTSQVMQWADFRLQLYSKNTGGAGLNPIGNALPGNLFWSPNSPCAAQVGADGLVQFDKQASVWLVAMRTGANQECIAVSQSSDASQQYNEYVVQYIDSQYPN